MQQSMIRFSQPCGTPTAIATWPVCFLLQRKAPLARGVYAFYAEIARVRDTVKEPLPGESPAAWWRDILENQQSDGAGAIRWPKRFPALHSRASPSCPRSAGHDRCTHFSIFTTTRCRRAALEAMRRNRIGAHSALSLILDPKMLRNRQTQPVMPGCSDGRRSPAASGPVHIGTWQVYLPAELLSATRPDGKRFLPEPDDECDRKAVSRLLRLGRDHLAKAL